MVDAILESTHIKRRIESILRSPQRRIVYVAYFIMCMVVSFYFTVSARELQRLELYLMLFFFLFYFVYRSFIVICQQHATYYLSITDIVFFNDGRPFQPVELNMLAIETVVVVLYLRFSTLLISDIHWINIQSEKDEDFMKRNQILSMLSILPIFIENTTFLCIYIIVKLASLSSFQTSFKDYCETNNERGPTDPPNENYNRVECTICKVWFEKDDIVQRLKCKHIFHPECINEWFNVKKCCPLCRTYGVDGDSIREILQG